jgi:hypothetical protein
VASILFIDYVCILCESFLNRNKNNAANANNFMSLISNDYLTTSQFATLKNVSPRTIQKWVNGGLVDFFQEFAGRRCFDKAKAIAFEPPKRGRKMKGAE